MANDDDNYFSEKEESENKYSSFILKCDNELFNDKDNISHRIINVKRVNLRKGEDWEIKENNKTVLLMKGTRFTTAEKDFLRSVEGMKFIVASYKSGFKSVVKIKEELKKIL